MKRVLLVVSAYQPAMLADMQRARMLAWELHRFDWTVEVLTPKASEVRQDVIEPDATQFFPADVPVHEVGSLCRWFFEALGSRTHGWRTLVPLYRRGCQLLGSGRFDLVFFSTTTFVYFALGPQWERQFKVPYVLDFHDPWVKERPQIRTNLAKWKSRFAEWLSGKMERAAVVHAAGLIAVSPHYIEMLRNRYEQVNPAWFAPGRHAVIPFGALEQDFSQVRSSLQPAARNPGNAIAVVYVGAGGQIMVRGFTLLCRALATLRRSGNNLVNRIHIELFGTIYDWGDGETKDLAEVASQFEVRDLVVESPARVSYRQALELLHQADGALVLGVDDESYMPSKLYTYALSGKPLLALLRRESPGTALFQRKPGLGHLLWFDAQGDMPLDDAVREVGAFLEEAAARQIFDRRSLLEPCLAPAMARRHAGLFDACTGSHMPAIKVE